MKELEDLAEMVRTKLNLEYDEKSVKFIEGFIERQRVNFGSEQREGIINSLGSFIGECVRRNYGGSWSRDEQTQAVCVEIDEENKVFPFAKTAKQFENGLADSVHSFYQVIPVVFKLAKRGSDQGDESHLIDAV